MRRGAAWPLAERPSSCLTARSAVSRTDRWPHRRACMGRRAPQAPSAGTRFGIPAGTRSAWWPRISGAGPALSACPVLSSIRCPVSCVRCPVSSVHASSVHACDVHATGVQRPGVRCPVWASGVRCPVGRPGIRRPLSGRSTSAVSEPGEFVKRADAASSHTARTAGVGVVAPHGIHDRLVVCPSRSLTLEAGAGVLGQRRRRLGRGRREVSASGRARPPGRPGGAVAQGPLVGREPGTRRGSPTAAWLGAGRQGHDRRHEADHDLGAGWPAPGGPWRDCAEGVRPRRGPGRAVGATGLGAAAL
jgi:hypothetical protein